MAEEKGEGFKIKVINYVSADCAKSPHQTRTSGIIDIFNFPNEGSLLRSVENYFHGSIYHILAGSAILKYDFDEKSHTW